MSFLDAIKKVVAPSSIEVGPVMLRETRETSSCAEISVTHRGPHFAINLRDNDHLKILRGDPGE